MKSKNVTVYSCSGCSNVAQLANSIAVKLHRSGEATMSCIAGVGGDVKPLVKAAQSAEKILALDGCPLECVLNCLKRQGVTPDVHVILTEHGLTKNSSEDVSIETSQNFYQQILETVKKIKDDGI